MMMMRDTNVIMCVWVFVVTSSILANYFKHSVGYVSNITAINIGVSTGALSAGTSTRVLMGIHNNIVVLIVPTLSYNRPYDVIVMLVFTTCRTKLLWQSSLEYVYMPLIIVSINSSS